MAVTIANKCASLPYNTTYNGRVECSDDSNDPDVGLVVKRRNGGEGQRRNIQSKTREHHKA